ncbi:MAG: Rossmann-like and DUF2520 domain-containing protein [Acidobacteriota bacterium]
MEGISIIGPGRLGGALALALNRSGNLVESIVYRTPGAAILLRDAMRNNEPRLVSFDALDEIAAPVILITSADPEIAGIAAVLAEFVTPGTIVLHTSGSLSSDILSGLRAKDCSTGSMHPLVSISDPILGADRFGGVYFCIEGDAAAVDAATEIAAALGARPFAIATNFKQLYHAAAVTASGHLVTVINVAIEMLTACGIEESTAKEVLMPLVFSTLENLRTQTPTQALTGTFARADADAFDRHMTAMSGRISGEAIDIYLAIAERSVHLAEMQGVDAEAASAIRNRISIAKKNRE